MKIFECVPNFSDGQNPSIISHIVEAASQVSGVRVLDIESNADHNRSVLTLVGPGPALKEAAFQATKMASQLIDLNQHKGEHPRMGAMDVVPFIPLGDSTMEEAVALAVSLGERLWKELSIPVYLYARAARIPERADLAYVRKGEFEGLKASVPSDPGRKPDIGDPRLHPTAGAIAVGARPILIAYNVYLSTSDVSVAKKIAHAVRARDGGLAEVKALGFEIKERNLAQVSMNLTDYRKTPMHRALEMVRVEAGRYGAGVLESEIVGLVPEDALVDAAEHYLQLNQFNRETILERKLYSKDGGFLESTTLSDYISALSARTPTPGGGSASALVAALGVALGEMVLRYSGPAGSTPPEASMVLERLSALRRSLSNSIKEDSDAYDGVRVAKKMAKNLPQDEGARSGYLKSLERAAGVPLLIAKGAKEAHTLISRARPMVKEVMLSDFLSALSFLSAAKEGAMANVEANLITLRVEKVDTQDIEAVLRSLREAA